MLVKGAMVELTFLRGGTLPPKRGCKGCCLFLALHATCSSADSRMATKRGSILAIYELEESKNVRSTTTIDDSQYTSYTIIQEVGNAFVAGNGSN